MPTREREARFDVAVSPRCAAASLVGPRFDQGFMVSLKIL
jgi:hypothetical protein